MHLSLQNEFLTLKVFRVITITQGRFEWIIERFRCVRAICR